MSVATATSVAYITGMMVAKNFDPTVNPLSLPDIALARNLFLSVWYEKSNAKYILMIDDDMEIPPDLPGAMIDLDEPVVGCIYPKKAYPIQFVFNGDLHPERRVEHPNDDRFCQVDGMGFGCTLIRRDAINHMLESGLPFQTENIDKLGINPTLKNVGGLDRLLRPFDLMKAEDGVLISEDLSFCKRWTQVGGKLWAAVGWEIGHFGPNVWRAQFNMYGVEDGKVVVNAK